MNNLLDGDHNDDDTDDDCLEVMKTEIKIQFLHQIFLTINNFITIQSWKY